MSRGLDETPSGRQGAPGEAPGCDEDDLDALLAQYDAAAKADIAAAAQQERALMQQQQPRKKQKTGGQQEAAAQAALSAPLAQDNK